ncbi:hypothetical protein [Richelia sinica]|nr:hypothetical protein [Richelia sinica]MBD2663501.1 hypothetical protein [Richelia sinica FACHB-800]
MLATYDDLTHEESESSPQTGRIGDGFAQCVGCFWQIAITGHLSSNQFIDRD